MYVNLVQSINIRESAVGSVNMKGTGSHSKHDQHSAAAGTAMLECFVISSNNHEGQDTVDSENVLNVDTYISYQLK